MIKLIYSTTLTLLFLILPSKPMTYEVVDKGTTYNYFTLKNKF